LIIAKEKYCRGPGAVKPVPGAAPERGPERSVERALGSPGSAPLLAAGRRSRLDGPSATGLAVLAALALPASAAAPRAGPRIPGGHASGRQPEPGVPRGLALEGYEYSQAGSAFSCYLNDEIGIRFRPEPGRVLDLGRIIIRYTAPAPSHRPTFARSTTFEDPPEQQERLILRLLRHSYWRYARTVLR
jgi:hypothetical protein